MLSKKIHLNQMRKKEKKWTHNQMQKKRGGRIGILILEKESRNIAVYF